MNDDHFYTTEALAVRWKCTPQYIMTLCRAGDLRAFRFGPELWQIPVCEVERWEAGLAVRLPAMNVEAEVNRTHHMPEAIDTEGG
jgi:hypothetical protein